MNVGKGELRDPTNKYRRNNQKKQVQGEQESMDYLFPISSNKKK